MQATIYEDKHAEIAYMFFPDFWGQGYAAEAASELCHYLFNKLQVLEIIVSVDTGNHASIKLAERLGFSHIETVDCTLSRLHIKR